MLILLLDLDPIFVLEVLGGELVVVNDYAGRLDFALEDNDFVLVSFEGDGAECVCRAHILVDGMGVKVLPYLFIKEAYWFIFFIPYFVIQRWRDQKVL